MMWVKNHIYNVCLPMMMLVTVPCGAQTPSDTIPHTFVVVNLETGVPVRDILVYTDDGQETKSKWDGTFALKRTFGKVNLSHPNFEKRSILKDKINSDTIGLLPNVLALNEVVIWGRRPNSALNKNVLPPKTDLQLMKQQPQGFNLLGLLALGVDELWGKKIRRRAEMKKRKREMILDNY